MGRGNYSLLISSREPSTLLGDRYVVCNSYLSLPRRQAGPKVLKFKFHLNADCRAMGWFDGGRFNLDGIHGNENGTGKIKLHQMACPSAIITAGNIQF